MKMYFKPVFLFNDNENGNLDPPDWAGSLNGGDEGGVDVTPGIGGDGGKKSTAALDVASVPETIVSTESSANTSAVEFIPDPAAIS